MCWEVTLLPLWTKWAISSEQQRMGLVAKPTLRSNMCSIVLTVLRFLLSATVARLLKVRPPLWGRSASRIGETTHTDCSSALSDQADGRFSTLRVRLEGWPTWTHTGGCFSFHVPSGGQLWKKSSPGGYRHIQWGKLIKSHSIGQNMDQEDFPELKIEGWSIWTHIGGQKVFPRYHHFDWLKTNTPFTNPSDLLTIS